MKTTLRRCYICGHQGNPIVIEERPIEKRFGLPVLPADVYELAACRGCGALYVDCDVSEEYLEALYRSESADWQRSFLAQTGLAAEAIGVSRLPEFEAHWRELVRHRRPSASDTLLDLGCQTGEFGSVAWFSVP